jgi:hypothetical protein
MPAREVPVTVEITVRAINSTNPESTVGGAAR